MPPLHIQGMHGIGDSLHQRAPVRQLMQKREVILETSWPAMYHDLIAEGLRVSRRPVALRTQTKNANRETEAAKYSPLHQFARPNMRIAYGGGHVLQTPSKTILEVMCDVTGTSFADADYRLPIPDAWHSLLASIIGHPTHLQEKPWMFYRPLVARPEWRGGMARNADAVAYRELFDSIRDEFFVVSVADLEDGKEWLVDPDDATKADLTFHRGELVFEALAALAWTSSLVFTSSGFGAILGPAVETPTFSVVGGYEDPRCHDSGAKFAPYLAIGPNNPCSCWSSQCGRVCDKTFDVAAAKEKLRLFVLENC